MTDKERLDVAWELNARLSMDLGREDLQAAALTVLKLRLLLGPPADPVPAPVVAEVPKPWNERGEKEEE